MSDSKSYPELLALRKKIYERIGKDLWEQLKEDLCPLYCGKGCAENMKGAFSLILASCLGQAFEDEELIGLAKRCFVISELTELDHEMYWRLYADTKTGIEFYTNIRFPIARAT